MLSITRYLLGHYGVSAIQPFVKKDISGLPSYFRKNVRRPDIDIEYRIRASIQDSILSLLGVSKWPDDGWGYTTKPITSFTNRDGDVIALDRPGTIVGIGSSFPARKNFQVSGRKGSVGISGHYTLVIVIGGDTLRYDPSGMLSRLGASRKAFAKDPNRDGLLVPNGQMQDTLQIGRSRVIVRFGDLNGGYPKANESRMTIFYYDGYLLITN
jgi:hypothetical protein